MFPAPPGGHSRLCPYIDAFHVPRFTFPSAAGATYHLTLNTYLILFFQNHISLKLTLRVMFR